VNSASAWVETADSKNDGKKDYRDPLQPSRNLHVTGFSEMCSPHELVVLFSLHAKVREVVLKQREGEGGKYAFVNTCGIKHATNAQVALDGIQFQGKTLKVAYRTSCFS